MVVRGITLGCLKFPPEVAFSDVEVLNLVSFCVGDDHVPLLLGEMRLRKLHVQLDCLAVAVDEHHHAALLIRLYGQPQRADSSNQKCRY